MFICSFAECWIIFYTFHVLCKTLSMSTNECNKLRYYKSTQMRWEMQTSSLIKIKWQDKTFRKEKECVLLGPGDRVTFIIRIAAAAIYLTFNDFPCPLCQCRNPSSSHRRRIQALLVIYYCFFLQINAFIDPLWNTGHRYNKYTGTVDKKKRVNFFPQLLGKKRCKPRVWDSTYIFG